MVNLLEIYRTLRIHHTCTRCSPFCSPHLGDPSALGAHPTPAPRHFPSTTPMQDSPLQSSCQALYDFDAECAGELGFVKGDIIYIRRRIDDNVWISPK